jgi:hypothetical protein
VLEQMLAGVSTLKGVKTPFRHAGMDSEVLAALCCRARFGTLLPC